MTRPIRAARSHRSPWSVAPLALLLALMMSAAGLAGLRAAGLVELSWLAAEPSRAGLVPVPMSNQPIPAFTRITRDHVADPQTGAFNVQWLPKDKLSPAIMRDPSQIVGRVLSHDKLPNYAFVEEDFLPPGTRPGLVGGTPPGKRSLTLDAQQLSGVHGLKAGDHVDLLSTMPIDGSSSGGGGDARSKEMAIQADAAKMRKRAAVRVLAQDAVVVTPVTTRAKPVSVGSLMNGMQSKTVPVQEVVVAVAPEEVAPINEAVATQVTLTCVIRSGRPDDPGPSVKTPGADPLGESSIKVVESLSGKRRDALVFSASGTPLTPAGGAAADSPAAPGSSAADGSSSATGSLPSQAARLLTPGGASRRAGGR